MSKETVQNVLNELVEGVKGVVAATLKEDGSTAQDSQYQALIQKLNDVSQAINGIREDDIRVSDESALTEEDRYWCYPMENLLLDHSVLCERAEAMVNQALYARTDLANTFR